MRRALAALALGLLAGCGFHLQGSHALPRTLASVRIETTDSQTDFCHDLRAALRVAGTRLDAGADASATIRILADGASQKVLTVSTLNIPTAYTLSYHVRVAVESAGRELMAPEEHTLTREYRFDETTLLAMDREREVLERALADDLVALLMRRFAAL